jgi:hypothetical protein
MKTKNKPLWPFFGSTWTVLGIDTKICLKSFVRSKFE